MSNITVEEEGKSCLRIAIINFIAEVEPTFLGGGTEGFGFRGRWLDGFWCGLPYGVLLFYEELVHLHLFVSWSCWLLVSRDWFSHRRTSLVRAQ